MSGHEIEFPIIIDGHLKPVGADYIRENWKDCWSDIVIIRNQLSAHLDDPKTTEGAKALIEAIDSFIEQNPMLQVPINDVLDMAEFLGFGEKDWPNWYKKLTGLEGGKKVKILVSKGVRGL